MILVQIATALAIGAYVVLSKDAQHKRLDATPRESLRRQHSKSRLHVSSIRLGPKLSCGCSAVFLKPTRL